MSNFNPFASMAKAVETLSNKRVVVDEKPEFVVSSTTGQMRLTGLLARQLGITLGDRVFIQTVDATRIPVAEEGTTIKDDKFFVVSKGILSNNDILSAEFAATTTLVRTTDSEKTKVYNTAMKTFVEEQMAVRGLNDNNHAGNITCSPGNGLQFTTQAPWLALGGDGESVIAYEATIAYAIAYVEDKFILVTDANKAEVSGEAFATYVAVVNNNITFKVGTVADALEDAYVFGVLKNAVAEAKQERKAKEEGAPKAAKAQATPVNAPSTADILAGLSNDFED